MTTPASTEKARQQHTLFVVSIAGLVIGVVLAAWGAQMAFFRADLAFRGKTAVGIVVSLERGRSTRSTAKPAYYPVVRYRTRDGRSVTFRHGTGQNPTAYRPGDEVEVLYLPETPEGARIRDGWRGWLMPVVLLIAGTALAVASLRGVGSARERLRELR